MFLVWDNIPHVRTPYIYTYYQQGRIGQPLPCQPCTLFTALRVLLMSIASEVRTLLDFGSEFGFATYW